MNNHEGRKQHTFMRVRDFGIEHAADFEPNSPGTQLFATMSSIVDALELHNAVRLAREGDIRQQSTRRKEGRVKLRNAVLAIGRTSQPIAREIPGLDDKFRMPVSRADQELLSAARVALEAAAPLAAEFISRKRPADFLDELGELIELLETAISDQAENLGQRVAARAAIEMNLEKGSETIADLDPIVKNRYEDQPDILAQWTSVKHTERDPRRSSQVTTSSTTTSTSTTTNISSSSAGSGSSASPATPGSSSNPSPGSSSPGSPGPVTPTTGGAPAV